MVSRVLKFLKRTKMAKETKYFMAGTDEEVLLGDVIEVVLIKDFKDGRKIKRNMELKLTEATLPYALDLGVIEEDEPEEDNDLLDFGEDNDTECPYETSIEDILEDQEALENRMDDLEKKIGEFIKESRDFMKNCLKELDDEEEKNKKPNTKTASSTKK